jgi:phage-related minor tail protein
MSQSLRFSGYFDFYFTQQTQGGDINNYFINIDNRIQTINNTTKQATQSSQRYGTSMRRLALDLRLVSSSIQRMVNVTGMQDTVLGKVSDTFVVVTGAATAFISASNVLSKIMPMIAKQGGVMAASMNLISKAASGLANFLTSGLGIALVTILAGVTAFNAVFADVTGINRYKDSISALEEDIEGVEEALKSLTLAQQGLGVQSAALAAQQAHLDAQFKQGMITEEQYNKQSEMLEINRANLGSRTAELAYQEKFYQFEVAQNKQSIDDYNKAIEEQWQMRTKLITGRVGGQGGVFGAISGTARGIVTPDAWRSLFRGLGSMLGFQSGGIVNRTGPIYAHAGEQVIPAGESGPGMVYLTISMEGAHIYGSEGIEEALEVGGNKLRKQLEYMRRPRNRW